MSTPPPMPVFPSSAVHPAGVHGPHQRNGGMGRATTPSPIWAFLSRLCFGMMVGLLAVVLFWLALGPIERHVVDAGGTNQQLVFVHVTRGDTLWRIAQDTCPTDVAFADWLYRLAHVNGDPDRLYPGQVLQLPHQVVEPAPVPVIAQSTQ